MAERNPAFSTHRRPERVDPSPNVLTDAERAHIDDRLQAGVCPRFPAIRKAVRLADERGAALDQFRITTVSLTQDLEAERALLNRVRRVVEQAREMPHRYPYDTAITFIHNILIGDDNLV